MAPVSKRYLQDALEKASQRKWTTWVGYIFIGFSLFAAVKGQTYAVKNVTILPDYIDKSVPVFFLLILLEMIIDIASGKQYYRFNDSINSIFQGNFHFLKSNHQAYFQCTLVFF
jgi:hypothetical protein